MERTLNAGKRILSDEKAFEPATKASKTAGGCRLSALHSCIQQPSHSKLTGCVFSAETETPSTAHHSANKAAAGQPGAVPMAHPALVLTCAVSADKGTRTTMEDVHVCLMDDGVAKLARAAAGRSSNRYDGYQYEASKVGDRKVHKNVLYHWHALLQSPDAIVLIVLGSTS